MPWLINSAQLDKFRKNQRNVAIITMDDREKFLSTHIPGARFLDLAVFNDAAASLPKMLSTDTALISEAVRALGITNDSKIIFYDDSEHHLSCRALWMFKVFGHNPNQLYILDGGLQAWEKFGGKIETGEPKNSIAKSYQVQYQSHLIRTLADMKNNLANPTEQVIDMRHPIRYAGGQETNPELRQGHMPGSFSFPYMTMFESNQQWKPIEKIRKQLTGIGIDLSYPIVTTCGSGTTAAILNFALDLLGHAQHSLYDGSWSEWGANKIYPGESSIEERPVVTSLD